MPCALEFAALASGSKANVSVVRGAGGAILIDLGLGPRQLTERLGEIGLEWGDIQAALLTHTHGDHVQSSTLAQLARLGIRLYCHEGHIRSLAKWPVFAELERSRLVMDYDLEPFLTCGGMRVEPLELAHDGGPTYGFRIEDGGRREGGRRSLAVVTDTGSWTVALAEALTEVDLLALEFNHDEYLQRQSGRSPFLVERNLGRNGHLSNAQAAALLSEVLRRSGRRSPRHVVVMHLSQDCNRPELAIESARAVARAHGKRLEVHATSADFVTPHIRLGGRRRHRSITGARASWRIIF